MFSKTYYTCSAYWFIHSNLENMIYDELCTCAPCLGYQAHVFVAERIFYFRVLQKHFCFFVLSKYISFSHIILSLLFNFSIRAQYSHIQMT